MTTHCSAYDPTRLPAPVTGDLDPRTRTGTPMPARSSPSDLASSTTDASEPHQIRNSARAFPAANASRESSSSKQSRKAVISERLGVWNG